MKKQIAQTLEEALAVSLIYFSGGKLSQAKTKKFFKQEKFLKSPYGITEHFKNHIHSLAEQKSNQKRQALGIFRKRLLK